MDYNQGNMNNMNNMNNMKNMNNMNNMNNGNSAPVSNGLGTALGVFSLILSILGGILFGVIGAGIAVLLGIIAVVLSTNAKKKSNSRVGTGGFVCGLLGIIFGAIFAIGCAACGSQCDGYGCHGILGTYFQAANDVDKAVDGIRSEKDPFGLNDAVNELEDLGDQLNALDFN